MVEESDENVNENIGKLRIWVWKQIDQGATQDQIVYELIDNGCSCEIAVDAFNYALNMKKNYGDYLSLETMLIKVKQKTQGKKMMVQGIGYLAVGGIVTAGSYLFAGFTGGDFILCWGALLVGLIYTIIGFILWISQ